jgi:hypothetical protein
MRRIMYIERHELGPRVYLLGCRVHEYQAGLAVLGVSPVASVVESGHISLWTIVSAVVGAWLVIKDWPDLFPATRDTASWRWGVHRPPRESREQLADDAASVERIPEGA